MLCGNHQYSPYILPQGQKTEIRGRNEIKFRWIKAVTKDLLFILVNALLNVNVVPSKMLSL